MRTLTLTTIIIAIALFIKLPLALAVNAVGISDNGTMILNGRVLNYSYSTQGVMGVLTLYNASFTSVGFVGGNVASIQLNAVVTNGRYYYWVQDIAHLEPLTGSSLMVWFWDDLWNVSYPQAPLMLSHVRGSRVYPSNQQYAYYYRHVEPSVMVVKPPITVGCMVTVSLTPMGYINISYYYMLNATGIDTGWVRYDSVIVMDESTEAYITVGGFNPGGLSNDIEWVVAGYTAAAQLYVYYWNATAILMYEHDGHWYVPPSAQTRSFDTGESVNGVYGIREIYNELRGFVMQINGAVNNTYLWVPRAIASYSSGFLIIQLTPSGGRWITTIINPRGVAHRLSGSALRVKVNGTGRYIINVTLYAGNMSIVTYSYVVLVKGVEPWLQTTLLLIPLAAAVVLLVKLLGARHGQGL